MIRNASAVALLALCLAGCANTAITNLTPTQQPRNDAGIYPVEVELTSQQQTLRHETITPTIAEWEAVVLGLTGGMRSRRAVQAAGNTSTTAVAAYQQQFGVWTRNFMAAMEAKGYSLR